MRWEAFEREWTIDDRFGDRWHVRMTPDDGAGAEGSKGALAEPSQLHQLVSFAFDDGRVVDELAASALLAIYDALTGESLAAEADERRVGGGRLPPDIDDRIALTLARALGDGSLRIVAKAPAQWHVPDEDEEAPPSRPRLRASRLRRRSSRSASSIATTSRCRAARSASRSPTAACAPAS